MYLATRLTISVAGTAPVVHRGGRQHSNRPDNRQGYTTTSRVHSSSSQDVTTGETRVKYSSNVVGTSTIFVCLPAYGWLSTAVQHTQHKTPASFCLNHSVITLLCLTRVSQQTPPLHRLVCVVFSPSPARIHRLLQRGRSIDAEYLRPPTRITMSVATTT